MVHVDLPRLGQPILASSKKRESADFGDSCENPEHPNMPPSGSFAVNASTRRLGRGWNKQ
jgi:hypothetical protein